MTDRPAIAFVCAHLCDERLYAAQRAALDASLRLPRLRLPRRGHARGDGRCVLAAMPPRFTLVGLSLGGYVAFEIVAARSAGSSGSRCSTPGASPIPARRAGRHADIAKVEAGGIEALIPELPRAGCCRRTPPAPI